jgi:flagellar biosynthesis/type III secretory pathway protein FliH
MTVEMKKEAETMCGIGHAIAKKNLEKGLEQGLEQGLAKGLEKGRFEGRQEERESNIVAMLKEKIPMETISRITHYSLDQIQKLGKLHGLL